MAGIGGGAAAVIALILGGVSMLRADGAGGADGKASSASAAPVAGYEVEQAGEVATPASRSAIAATVSAPVIPAGRTPLTNGIVAERSGDTVVVTFDLRETRTRRSDKFETIVRATLPAVLGDAGRMALERVEPGTLVPAGQLIASLDAGPLRLSTGDGRVVSVMPGSRMGQDGPLVVSYQVVIDPVSSSPTS